MIHRPFLRVWLSVLLLLLNVSAGAQTYKVPEGAAYDAMVKAYTASMKTGDLAEVKKALPKMRAAYPGHPFTLYFDAFYLHASGEDLTGAMKGYSDAIRLAPDFSDPYVFRASLFADKGMYERAAADMDKAIGIEGANASSAWYKDKADFHASAGDAASGFEAMKQAIAKAPAEASYYRGAMNLAMKMGKPEAADPVFTTALNGSQSSNGDIRLVYAELLMRRQQFAEADAACKKTFATAGYNPDANACNVCGIVAYKQKDLDRAATILEQGIALAPTDADMICNRASVSIDQKKWEDVYKYAQKAIAANPNSPVANMMMAVGTKNTGRGDEAAKQYEAKAKQLEAAQK